MTFQKLNKHLDNNVYKLFWQILVLSFLIGGGYALTRDNVADNAIAIEENKDDISDIETLVNSHETSIAVLQTQSANMEKHLESMSKDIGEIKKFLLEQAIKE